MAKDLVYIYRSENQYIKEELGEIQTDFNMSFVLDGTKDSTKLQVISYAKIEIKPMSIIYHPNTNSWWVVKHDKIERYYNENGFFNIHNIDLLGAFDWLNSIDMTDHGYSNSRYTVRSVLFRLFKMSTLPSGWLVHINGQASDTIDQSEVVDYIKTFENYTLMSAIREFLDGYNMVGKVQFYETTTDNITKITGLNLRLEYKTGSTSVNESVFNSVREIKTMDDNSYGTTVVSNAENVVSTQAKTYPTVGTKRVSSQSNTISPENAIFRLPSPAFKVNWIKFVCPKNRLKATSRYNTIEVEMPINSKVAFHKQMENIANWFNSLTPTAHDIIMSYEDYLYEIMYKSCCITLVNVNQYNPQTSGKYPLSFTPLTTDPLFRMVEIHAHANDITENYLYHGNLWLTDSETYRGIDNQYKAVCWTKGSDIISSLVWLGDCTKTYQFTYISSYASTDLMSNAYDSENVFLTIDVGEGQTISFKLHDISSRQIRYDQMSGVIVNYIPMNDLKIKYDNTAKGNEILLYNQNGKLTDSVALSKLMDSYSKEIEHPNITREGVYYSYNSVPKVGNTCVIDNVRYVINNVSMDFQQNENDSYIINAEFTLSANVATKSLMTNADTNIRDYGIPQKDNVKRKQLYRDFYEINYEITEDSDYDYYLPITKCLNIGNFPVSQTEYTAVIKVEWYEQYENPDDHTITNENESWYYQLDTINYSMQKALYKVVDFKDNNIIGYDAQNAASAFQVQRIFIGLTDTINTPISYVKNTGGQDDGTIRDIHIAMCNETQLSEIYDYYQEYVDNGAYAGYTTRNLINWSVFIDSKIYEGGDLGNGHTLVGAKDNCDFMISEINYDKDAIEVPVFEYSCQIDDSEDVEIGDNIFDNKTDDIVYMYCFTFGARGGSPILKPNLASVGVEVRPNVDDDLIDIMNPYHNSYELMRNAVKLEFVDNDKLKITGYGVQYGTTSTPAFRYSSNGEISYDENNVIDFSDPYEFDDNLHIIRVAINKNTKIWSQNGERYVSEATIRNVKVDKMFTIKDIRSCEFDNGSIILHLNHYKLN